MNSLLFPGLSPCNVRRPRIGAIRATACAVLSLALAGRADAGDQVLWCQSGSIRSANLDGTGSVTLYSGQGDLAIHPVTNEVYWTDNSTLPGKLMKAPGDGSGTPTLTAFTVPGQRIHRFAIDPAGTGTAYWFDLNTLSVYSCSLPLGIATAIPTSAQTIRDLALDLRPGFNHLYIFDGARLYRSDLPGGTNEVQVGGLLGDGGNGNIALDPCNGTIYVISHTTPHPGVPVGYIRRAFLSGGPCPKLTGLTTLLSGDSSVGIVNSSSHSPTIAIDLKDKKLFWTSATLAATTQVRTCSLNGTGNTQIAQGNSIDGLALSLTDYGCYAIPDITIEAAITADNGYRFGYGTESGVTFMNPTVNNTLAADITSCGTGPEQYTVAVPSTGYLYLAAWSDDDVAQGLLGQFRMVAPKLGPYRYTGNVRWEVFATGIDKDATGPTDAEINAQVAIANTGTGGPGTSTTWANRLGTCGTGLLVVGEKNDTQAGTLACPNVYSQVCPSLIRPAARWVWYDETGGPCPFAPGANHREFLIFRLPVSALAIKNTLLEY